MTSKEGFYYWFAGLLDGEGSFVLYTKTTDSWRVATPILSVTLRADDLPILEECQREFGGSIQIRDRKNPKWAPVACWSVRKKPECVLLLDTLDKYPLRSKKRADYDIWREAVLVTAQFKRGGREARKTNQPLFEEVERLKTQLNAGRLYKEPTDF